MQVDLLSPRPGCPRYIYSSEAASTAPLYVRRTGLAAPAPSPGGRPISPRSRTPRTPDAPRDSGLYSRISPTGESNPVRLAQPYAVLLLSELPRCVCQPPRHRPLPPLVPTRTRPSPITPVESNLAESLIARQHAPRTGSTRRAGKSSPEPSPCLNTHQHAQKPPRHAQRPPNPQTARLSRPSSHSRSARVHAVPPCVPGSATCNALRRTRVPPG
ncbi:hypothetical protein BC628DRAFT_937819 [Trametes gibbosa]|nr:hypothetical protein BC628DRAFT_937819 [Trametes gibbosa]